MDLKADSAALTKAATTLQAIADEIESHYKTLKSEVDSVLGADWTGDAADGHKAIWEEWETGQKEVHEGLTTEVSLLQKAASNYSSTESSNASTLGTSTLGN